MTQEIYDKIKEFEKNVFPLGDFIPIINEALKRLDKRIKYDSDIFSPRDPVWGTVLDKFIADVIAEHTNNSDLKFTRCDDHNKYRDVKCISELYWSIEIKSALRHPNDKQYNQFNHNASSNIERSQKYKSMEELDYYLLIHIDRDCETCTSTATDIWFGCLCENDWPGKNLKSEKLDNCCLKLQ